MEDTKSLLMMVLHKIFQNQPKTIENMFQLIHNFNNGRIDKKNYEKTLKTICDLMNDELPSPILVYILTLVDMPQDFESESPIVEKMRRTHDFLPEINVRPHLLEYLNSMKPPQFKNTKIPGNFEIVEKNRQNYEKSSNIKPTTFVKPLKITRRTRKLLPKPLEPPKKLVDICANYVVNNENYLKEIYKKKQVRAWELINNDVFTGNQLEQCYSVVKDLNKKTKWLREFETDNISTELLMEEYINSDIFLRESHVYDEVNCDPFKLSEECEKAIDAMFKIDK